MIVSTDGRDRSNSIPDILSLLLKPKNLKIHLLYADLNLLRTLIDKYTVSQKFDTDAAHCSVSVDIHFLLTKMSKC